MNAIILAAGLGTRLRPLTLDRPKCMVAVGGKPMIERQIEYLHESGIKDITLVGGYKAEALQPLVDRYGVSLVINSLYDKINNISSMYAVLDRFGDSYVIEGDIFMSANIIRPDISVPTYFSVEKQECPGEWALVTDSDGTLQRIEILKSNAGGVIMSGVSYWPQREASIIADEVRRLFEQEDPTNLFWDNAVVNLLHRGHLTGVRVEVTDALHEIDTCEDLDRVEHTLGL